jgi:predicted negative regulator of RcsB-dependent stress response
METNAAQLPLSDKLWAWLETNRKQAVWGALALLVAGFLIAYFLWQQGEKEVAASEALSDVTVSLLAGPGPRGDVSGAYLKIAATYSKSSAGTRAMLLAGGSLFAESKYDQAKAEFERFTREHRDSPFLSEALLGIAACLDAQGKTNEAVTVYKELIDRHPTATVIPQAKFALANLYEGQNKPEEARTLFEGVVAQAGPYGSLGSEAAIRLEELQLKYPKLAVPALATTNAVPFKLNN